MAHFAELNSSNEVLRVIVVSNDDVNANGGDQHDDAETFVTTIVPHSTGGVAWKQCSYNHNFRGHYAGIGMTYITNLTTLGVASTDVFIGETKPYASWSIGINTARWYPPDNPGAAPELTDAEMAAGKKYVWNETNYNSNPSTAWVLT